MSYIAQLYLLFLLFYSWALIYITSLIGFGIACGVKYFLDGEISFAEFQLEYIPIFFLLIFTSIIFHRHEAEHVEKEEVLTSFGASIAHEMRNSLSISIGSSRIIQRIMSFSIEKNQLKNEVSIDMDDVLEIQQTMELLENSSFRTSMVIDLILKNVHNQQIETDKFKNHYIFDIISTAINEFGYKEGEKEKIRVLHIENFLLKGDKDLAVFVLLNLFNNAFNNNTSDNCEIQIWTEKHIKHNSLHIKDNGPGIPKEKLNVIFDRFITLGNNGGAGLGLTFCKRVMNSFKGEIICESEIGNYTEFIIQFPISNKLHFEKTTENDLNIKDDSEKKEVLVPIN